MNNRPFVIFGVFVAIIAVIGYLAFSKEGSDGAAAVPVASDDTEARDMFATNCGTCHTLAAGGTDGVVGPNLDQLLPTQTAPPSGTAEEVAKANESAYQGVYSRVVTAVTCGLEGRMPAGILQGDDAQQVAGFVAAYAGQLGDDQGPLVPADEREMPPAQPCSASGEEPGPGAGKAGAGAKNQK